MEVPKENIFHSEGGGRVRCFVSGQGRIDTELMRIVRDRKCRGRCEGGYVEVYTNRYEG